MALLAPAALAVTLATAGLPQDAQAFARAGITCTGTYTLDINSIYQFNTATSSFEEGGVANINIANGITTGSKDIYVHGNSVINAQAEMAIHGAYDYYGLNYPNIELNNDSMLNANAYNSIWNATIKLADQATFNINHDDATSTGLNIEFWDEDTSLKLNSSADSGTTEMSTSVLEDHPDYSNGTFGGYIYFNPVADTEINVTAAKLESTSDIRKTAWVR